MTKTVDDVLGGELVTIGEIAEKLKDPPRILHDQLIQAGIEVLAHRHRIRERKVRLSDFEAWVNGQWDSEYRRDLRLAAVSSSSSLRPWRNGEQACPPPGSDGR